jgi:hypothetical protein
MSTHKTWKRLAARYNKTGKQLFHDLLKFKMSHNYLFYLSAQKEISVTWKLKSN